MSRSPIFQAAQRFGTAGAFGLAFMACDWRDANVAPAAAEGERVEVSETPPPPAAVALGVIDVTHGEGCGVFGQDGTRAGIDQALRAAATRKRANYVHILELHEPRMLRNCFDHVFRAHALAYRVEGRPLPERACVPLCSPGYACQSGACVPLCNPSCSASEVCRMDRTCGPRTPPAKPGP
jgi:hypothetical protein